jgi:pyridoxal 5''-phosphate synthase, glutaminase subunit Pdx2
VRVGVLALQGDVREHISLLATLGVDAVGVRVPKELEQIDGLVLPGGESTVISKLLVMFGMMQPVRNFVASQPVLATCAGLILLSNEVSGKLSDQELIGGLDIVSSRNAYGSQTDSFEADVLYSDENSTAERVAFIRAPKILDSKNCTVLATLNGESVAVQQENIIAAAYHPELTGSTHLHSLFITEINKAQRR